MIDFPTNPTVGQEFTAGPLSGTDATFTNLRAPQAADSDNVDYQEYLAWLDAGNKPTPHTPPASASAELR